MNDENLVEPIVPAEVLRALIKYANAQAVRAEQHIRLARDHGLNPHPQNAKNVEGWTFVALALSELGDASGVL